MAEHKWGEEPNPLEDLLKMKRRIQEETGYPPDTMYCNICCGFFKIKGHVNHFINEFFNMSEISQELLKEAERRIQ